ncbi:MAG: hypothetical protein AAFY29_03380 [Pseudomonadota bacterium]
MPQAVHQAMLQAMLQTGDQVSVRAMYALPWLQLLAVCASKGLLFRNLNAIKHNMQGLMHKKFGFAEQDLDGTLFPSVKGHD